MNTWLKVTVSMCGALLGACQGQGAEGSGPAAATSGSAAAAAPAAPTKVSATGPIKVGILHSLSGTMAISETSLRDVALMTIENLNKAGGVMGRQLEPVVVDPASNWPLFAEKARQLIQKDGVAVVFGCWTSVSRKSVLPVFEELNGLLFYPVQYEGEESSWNVFYTGAAPNQQAIPAVEYLMSEKGGGAKKWVLLGTDYVYPRTTNKILRYFLHSKGVKDDSILEKYTPFGHADYQTIVAEVKKFAAGTPTAVVSTINGDSNVPFYKELANQGLKATDIPVVAFSVGEEELRGIDTKPLVGHLAAWNYFMSIDTPENKKFIEEWKAYVKEKNLPDAAKRVTNDPMEATYIGIKMWAQAVEQAGTTDVDAVRQAVGGQMVRSPSGFDIVMDGKNHHLNKPVLIAEVKADGQFNTVWKTEGPIRAMPWSPYVPESAKKVADWDYPWSCGNCTEPKFKVAGATAAAAAAPAAPAAAVPAK
jgi:urea transport system substrate-binding protein